MLIIESRTDLTTWIYDTRADVASLPRGLDYVEAVLDQIQFSDHPAWGDDWEEWLIDVSEDLIIETIHSVDCQMDQAERDQNA